jgi:hypothetical protein
MVSAREYIRANRATDPALAGYKDMPEAIFSQLSEAFKRAVEQNLISCWHMNEHESAAMWKLYSSSNDAVCIRSVYRHLRQCAHHEWLVSDKKVSGRAVFTDSMTTFDPDQSFDWAHCGLDQPCLAVDS